MRTTVTLEADVAKLVRRRMREAGTGFKQTLNEMLRDSAGAARNSRLLSEQYEVKTFSAAIAPGFDEVRLRQQDEAAGDAKQISDAKRPSGHRRKRSA